MKIVFLGTSAGIPTRNRGLMGIYIRVKQDDLLLDCGEGSQRQLLHIGGNATKISMILISHLHGDHFFGLYGLLQTCTLLHRKTPLIIVCPPLIQNYLYCLMKYTPFHLSFPLTITSPSPNQPIRREGYQIRCCSVSHGMEAYAYSIEEDPYPGKFHPEKARALTIPQGPLWKALQQGRTVEYQGQEITSDRVCEPPTHGLKITFSGDTRQDQGFAEFATGSTLLIHEATYLRDSDRPPSQEHTTLSEALQTADTAQCQWLALTHFSARYNTLESAPHQTPSGIPIIYAEDLLEIELTKTGKLTIKKNRH